MSDSTNEVLAFGRAAILAVVTWLVVAARLALVVTNQRPMAIVGPQATPAMRRQMSETLDVGFLDAFVAVLTFDFGPSFVTGRGEPALGLVGARLGGTVALVVVGAVVAAAVAAVPVWLARRGGAHRPHHAVGYLGAVPAVGWLAVLLVAARSTPLPSFRSGPVDVVVPAVALGLPLAAAGLRAAARDGQEGSAVVDAWLWGTWLVGAVVATDVVFGVGGVGDVLVDAVANGDSPVVVATLVVLSLPLVLAGPLRDVAWEHAGRAADAADDAIMTDGGTPDSDGGAADTDDGEEAAESGGEAVENGGEKPADSDGGAADSDGEAAAADEEAARSEEAVDTGPGAVEPAQEPGAAPGLGEVLRTDWQVLGGLVAFGVLLVAGIAGGALLSSPGLPGRRAVVPATLLGDLGGTTLVAGLAAVVGAVVGVPLGLAGGHSRVAGSVARVVDVATNVPLVVLALLVFGVDGPSGGLLDADLAIGVVAGLALASLVLRSTERAFRRTGTAAVAALPGAGVAATGGAVVAFLVAQLDVVGLSPAALASVGATPTRVAVEAVVPVALPALALLVVGERLRSVGQL